MSKKHNAAALPMVYLNLSTVHFRLDELKQSFDYTVKALNCTQIAPHLRRHNPYIIGSLIRVLRRAQAENIDLDADGAVDPGSDGVAAWLARFLVERGELSEAAKVISVNLHNDPGGELEQVLERLHALEGQNRQEANRWSFREKYLKRPLSRFNLCMAAAYLFGEEKMPESWRKFGEWMLAYAEKMRPYNVDVHLLRAWYQLREGRFGEAKAEIDFVLLLDPLYSRAWLHAGLLYLKMNKKEEAAIAFEQTLRLYPSCPKRKKIERLLVQLGKDLNAIYTASWRTRSLGNADAR